MQRINRTYIIVCILALAFIFSNCYKQNLNELPVETQTGSNTFGCKVNGVIYRPVGVPFSLSYAYDVRYSKANKVVSISTRNGDQFLRIVLDSVYQPGTYPIFNPIKNSFNYANASLDSACVEFANYNSTQIGSVIITRIDTINKIVSGRFSGILTKSSCDNINITEGRFDYKMDMYP